MVIVLIYFTQGLYTLEEEHHFFAIIKITLYKILSANSSQEFQWLEFFSGKARCTEEMRKAGFTAAKFDKMYLKDPKTFGRKTNWMDLTTPSGFALRGCNELDILN